jgi:hypothetical protein
MRFKAFALSLRLVLKISFFISLFGEIKSRVVGAFSVSGRGFWNLLVLT